MPIKLNSTNGSITLTAEDGSGNAGLTIPRAGYLLPNGNGANLTNVLTLSGGAMTGAITTNSTFDGVDIATRDGVLSTTVTTANAALPKAGGSMSGGLGMGANDITSTGKILYSNMYAQTSDLPSASTYHGMFAHVHATGKGYFAHGGAWIELANQTDLATTTTTAGNANTLAAAALPKAGGTMSGLVNMADQIVQRPLLQDYSEKTVAMGSATAVNLEDGNVFSRTISGTTTLTFTNPSSVGTSSFTLILTNAGSATLTFPTVKWPAATAPTLTASGIDVLIFVYHGSTWYGIASGIGMA